jgi:hypothetical protein
MLRNERLTSTQRAYMKNFLQTVENERAQPYTEEDIQNIRAGMSSEDEQTRAKAVLAICPCRMSWEVFHEFRKSAKRLQQDISPLVRANARHIEEDAHKVASIEAQMENLEEFDAGDCSPQKRRRNHRQRP